MKPRVPAAPRGHRGRSIVCGSVLLGLVTGCNSLLTGGDGTPLPAPPCSGAYADADFGVRFAPPPGAIGPTLLNEEPGLRVVTWQSPPSAREVIAAALTYPVVPLTVAVEEAVAGAVESQRELLSAGDGNVLLTDEALVLDGGNEAYVLTAASDDGRVASVSVTAAGAERFATVFLVGNTDAIETMLVSALSLCVE